MYIPNIIAGAGQIADTASLMTANGGSFGKALYSAFIYGTFQLANVAVFCLLYTSIPAMKEKIREFKAMC